MSDVKITNVEGIYLRSSTMRDRSDSSQDSLIVRVSTDAGIVGFGEVDSGPVAVKAIIDSPTSHRRARGLREILLGQNPLEPSRLWDLMYASTLYYGREGTVIHAMAGVDMALWDLKGKLLGQPVHRLLGGAYRQQVRAYASHMFDFDPKDTERRAAEAVDAGYTAVKFGFEPLGADPELDEALVAAVRRGAGDKALVCIDAGMAWDARTALQRCRLFAPYDVYFLEEPLHPDDLEGYGRLTSSSEIPIAAGEKEGTVAGFLRLMDIGRISIVQVDPSRVGLTQAMRIAALANARGLQCANHNFATDINGAASLHFLSAIPNALLFEYCAEPSVLRSAVTKTPIRIVDGYAQVPQGPGLGLEIDLEGVERYVVAN